MRAASLSPTRAARLVAWGNAFVSGWTSLDEASERAAGGDAWHRVDGLPSGDDVSLPVALGRLSTAGVRGFRLALPVPGDVSDLPGPLGFNVEALAAGEAVLFDGVDAGLVPTVVRHGTGDSRDGTPPTAVRWRLLETEPTSRRGPSLAEADRTLAEAVRLATGALAALDVAGMAPSTAAALFSLRSAPAQEVDLPAGYPDRARDVLRRAWWLVAVLSLAADDTGAAVSASEITARRERLVSVGAAARRAIVAAHNAPTEAPGDEARLPR